jgi:alcohol dehydrogenase class IV
MNSFNFYQPTRIHFGAGKLDDLGSIAHKYGTRCLLVTTTKEEKALRPLYDRILKILKISGLDVIHFDGVVPNPTIGSIGEAIKLVNRHDIQLIVPVGGGSSLDTAKSISLFYGAGTIDWDSIWSSYTDPFAEYEALSDPILPIVSVPTTSGTGSQLTQAMVISDPDKNEKNCIFHDKVFSKETIIDPELMLTLPRGMTALTGFDAFTHACESYLNDTASPYTSLIGMDAMKTIIETLPVLLKEPGNLALREKMAYADMLAGISLTNAAATIPHPLSEIIGGVVPGIPHGQCLAVVYPEFIDFILESKIEKCAALARLFDPRLEESPDRDAAENLKELILNFLDSIGINKRLSELGVSRKELDLMSRNYLLDILPWASKDVLFSMIANRF